MSYYNGVVQRRISQWATGRRLDISRTIGHTGGYLSLFRAYLIMDASELLHIINCAVTSWTPDQRAKAVENICNHPPSSKDAYRLVSDLLGVAERAARFGGQHDDELEGSVELVEVFVFRGISARLRTAKGNLPKGEYEHLRSLAYAAMDEHGNSMWADLGITKQRSLIGKARRAGFLGVASALALDAAVSMSQYFPGSSQGMSKLIELLGFPSSPTGRPSPSVLGNTRATMKSVPRPSTPRRKRATMTKPDGDRRKHRKGKAQGLSIGVQSPWNNATEEAERSLTLPPPSSSSVVEVEGWRSPSMIFSRLYYALEEMIVGKAQPSPTMHPSRLRQQQEGEG